MWKVYVLLYSLLLITWYVLLCIMKNHLMKTTPSIEANLFNNNNTGATINFENITVSKKDSTENKIKQHIPRFMLELYENGVKSGYNLSLPDIVRSVIPKNAVIMEYEQKYKDYKDNHLLIFDVPPANSDENFVGAELKILSIVEVDPNSLHGLQKVVKISIYDDKEQEIIPLQEINAFYRNNTWLSFNITNAVKEILSRNEKFLKLVISIKTFLSYLDDRMVKFKLSLLPINEDFEHDYPVLLLTYSSAKNVIGQEEILKKRKRRKRDILEDDYLWDEKGNTKKTKRVKNICKRKSLYVDFAEIRYDSWIVQPRGYEAYQCHGRCFYPVAEHLSPTKHAIIQALLHSVDPTKAPRLCCVPTKLSSISVLYIDEKGVLTYRFAYKDMVVSECGCR
ncbi:tgf-beta family [Holotrichia oblita]|uniref:Tgf-beta family n=1 Tax=Holotrichia oblita TaxID=644536 RepID=A0ACB9SRJ8_HOLOL|nr:tgf-beta family [Holotrichia oblita]